MNTDMLTRRTTGEIPSDFAAKLKKYRLDRDLTLERIAGITDLSIETIRNLENGWVKPQERSLAKLKRYLPGFLDECS